ncbi:MAG TPA: hypothetical protein VHI13_02660 [Candidatus Kapabacteria bacterium]|nr:hypothetical protein [Candidatus Kapabacteria bacterium]
MLLLACMPVAAATTLHAQDFLWDMRYGGDQTDWATAIIRTNDGGFLLMGSSESVVGGPRAISSGYVVKTDSAGNRQWDQAIGTAEHTALLAGQQMPDGGYLVVGYHTNRETNPGQIARLDRNGTVLWQRSFGTDSSGAVVSLFDVDAATSTPEHGFLIAGRGLDSKIGYWKIDSLGALVWQKSYLGTAPDPEFPSVSEYPVGLAQLRDGGYVATGYTNATITGNYHAFALRLNAQGDSVWWHEYQADADEGKENSYGSGIIQTDDGFMIVGSSTENTSIEYKALAIHADANGIETGRSYVSQLDWGMKADNFGFASIAPLGNGAYVATGTVTDLNTNLSQALLTVLSAQGVPVRTVGVGKTGDGPRGSATIALPGSRFAIVGTAGSTTSVNSDALLIMAGPSAPSAAPAAEDLPTKLDLTELDHERNAGGARAASMQPTR